MTYVICKQHITILHNAAHSVNSSVKAYNVHLYKNDGCEMFFTFSSTLLRFPHIYHVCGRWTRPPVTCRNASWESCSVKDQRWLLCLTQSLSSKPIHMWIQQTTHFTLSVSRVVSKKIIIIKKKEEEVWSSILSPLDHSPGALDSWIHPSFTITWCNLSKQGQSWTEDSGGVQFTAAHLLHVYSLTISHQNTPGILPNIYLLHVCHMYN